MGVSHNLELILMPQSLSKVYSHIIFSTKHRQLFIDENIQPYLYDYLGGVCKGLECNPIQIGGYLDHVHILCLLSRKLSQMRLLEEVKKQSSMWIKKQDEKYSSFYWQEGYGIFSVSPLHVDRVVEYIKNQEVHHKSLSFKDEFKLFLNNYNVDYDERYVFD